MLHGHEIINAEIEIARLMREIPVERVRQIIHKWEDEQPIVTTNHLNDDYYVDYDDDDDWDDIDNPDRDDDLY